MVERLFRGRNETALTLESARRDQGQTTADGDATGLVSADGSIQKVMERIVDADDSRWLSINNPHASTGDPTAPIVSDLTETVSDIR